MKDRESLTREALDILSGALFSMSDWEGYLRRVQNPAESEVERAKAAVLADHAATTVLGQLANFQAAALLTKAASRIEYPLPCDPEVTQTIDVNTLASLAGNLERSRDQSRPPEERTASAINASSAARRIFGGVLPTVSAGAGRHRRVDDDEAQRQAS